MALTVFSFQTLGNHTQDSAGLTQLSLNADKLLPASSSAPRPPGQPQDSVNGPCNQPSGDKALQVIGPPEGSPAGDKGLAAPVSLRKSRPVSMDARIQVAEEKRVTDQGGDLGLAASRSQKAGQSRPNSSALETLGGEKLANGSLEPPAQAVSSRRDSDSGSLSTCDSMDYGTSLSADLALNKETGSLSIKVMPHPALGRGQEQGRGGRWWAVLPLSLSFPKPLAPAFCLEPCTRSAPALNCFLLDSDFNLPNVWVLNGIR